MRRLTLVGLVVALSALPSLARAQLITFDDVHTSPPAPNSGICPVPALANGYQGFDWFNFYVLRGSDHYCMIPGGYRNGVVSSSNVAFNGNGSPASVSRASPFTFSSVYLTAAWNDGLNVLVQGYRGPTLLYHQMLVLSVYAPTRYVFNWSGVDAAWFTSSGGAPVDYLGRGEHAVFDNMLLSPDVVPEPATLLLLGTGLTGIAGVVRRRRRNSFRS